jgi:hypothetical protein
VCVCVCVCVCERQRDIEGARERESESERGMKGRQHNSKLIMHGCQVAAKNKKTERSPLMSVLMLKLTL